MNIVEFSQKVVEIVLNDSLPRSASSMEELRATLDEWHAKKSQEGYFPFLNFFWEGLQFYTPEGGGVRIRLSDSDDGGFAEIGFVGHGDYRYSPGGEIWFSQAASGGVAVEQIDAPYGAEDWPQGLMAGKAAGQFLKRLDNQTEGAVISALRQAEKKEQADEYIRLMEVEVADS